MSVVVSDGLEPVASDVVEVAFDATLDDGVLKDLPVVGTLIRLVKLGGSIRDVLLGKKIFAFLSEVATLRASERARVVDELAGTTQKKEKVGEIIIDLLDKAGSDEKAGLIGKLFVAVGRRRLKPEDYLRLAAIISQTSLADLVMLAEQGVSQVNNDRRYALQASGMLVWEILNPARSGSGTSLNAIGTAIYDTKFELDWALSQDGEAIIDVCFKDRDTREVRNQRVWDEVVLY